VAGHPQHRLGGVGDHNVEVLGQPPEDLPPTVAVVAELVGGPIDRPVQCTGRAVVERVGAIDRRLPPPKAAGGEVELGEERRRAAIGCTAEQ